MRQIKIVALKEVREMLRDRRVLFGAFIMPALLVMLFSNLMGTLEKVLTEKPGIKVSLIGDDSDAFLQALKQEDRVEFVKETSLEAAKKKVREGESEIGLEVRHAENGALILNTFYTSEKPRSMIAFSAVQRAADEVKARRLKSLITEQGLSEKDLEPVRVDGKDVGQKKGLAGSPFSGMLPYLIILWTFYSGMSLVSDMIAGEKEKGTLETLLVSPLRRSEAAIGKMVALAMLCLLGGLTSLLGLLISQVIGGAGTIQGGLQVSPMTVAVFFAVLVPLALMFSTLMTSVSSLAKSTRESQTYLTVVSFLIIMPAILSQFVGLTGADKSAWSQWMPVLNSSLVLQEAIRGRFNGPSVLIAVGGSVVLAILFGAAAVKLFNREQILNRT